MSKSSCLKQQQHTHKRCRGCLLLQRKLVYRRQDSKREIKRVYLKASVFIIKSANVGMEYAGLSQMQMRS